MVGVVARISLVEEMKQLLVRMVVVGMEQLEMELELGKVYSAVLL